MTAVSNLRLGMFLLLSLAVAGVGQAGDAETQMRDINKKLLEDMEKEMQALEKMSAATVNLDKQLKAIEELKMMQQDLERVRAERLGTIGDNERARSEMELAKTTILQSANQIQNARSDAEVEKAMAAAKAKIAAFKRRIALVQRAEVDKDRAAMEDELQEILDDLAKIRKTFSRELATNEKARQQLDALEISVMKLRSRLRKSNTFELIREVAKAVDAVKVKINILKSDLILLSGKKPTLSLLAGPGSDEPLSNTDTDFFMNAPLETINLVFSKYRIAKLFYNNAAHYWSGEARGIHWLLLLAAALMGCSLAVSTITLFRR